MTDEIIELGISRALRGERDGLTTTLLQLIDQILKLLPETVLPADASREPQFREELAKLRGLLLKAADHSALEAAGRSLLSLCERRAKQVRGYLTEREKTYTEMIQLLRTALAEIAGQSDEFNNRMLDSSDRLGQLVQVQDIKVLREHISTEVGFLKSGIIEKKRQDALMQARLSTEIDSLRQRLEQAREEAALDPLTQVANRRSFERILERWTQQREGKDGGTFVLAMLDIDDFKRINDTHGHPIGDRVLLSAAQMISNCIRETDFLARYGGEEFAVLMRGVRLPQAETRLATMLESIARSSFEYQNRRDLPPVQFTVSCGIAEFSPGDTPAEILASADEALYEAKKRGKNQVRSKKKSFLSSILDRRKSPQE